MKGLIRILLSAALLTITFAFPFYIYPFGSYSGSSTIAGAEVKYSVEMSFDGKIKTDIAGYDTGESRIKRFMLEQQKILILTRAWHYSRLTTFSQLV